MGREMSCLMIFTKHVYERGVYDCQFSLKSTFLSLLEALKTCRDKKTFQSRTTGKCLIFNPNCTENAVENYTFFVILNRCKLKYCAPFMRVNFTKPVRLILSRDSLLELGVTHFPEGDDRKRPNHIPPLSNSEINVCVCIY